MQLESWLVFSSIAFIATISPGPAVLLVTSHSLQFGPVRAIMSILGNISGLLVMSAFSVLGLSALLMHSAVAFTIVKLVGALYLVYMGVKLWRNGLAVADPTQLQQAQTSLKKMYAQGLMVALTNPKAIVFTTALFPQFIDPSAALLPQFSILVVTFMAFSFICLLFYAIASHKATRFASGLFKGKLLGRCFGGTFIGAGALLATTTSN